MKLFDILAASAAAALMLPVVAAAQDMNTLSRHLDHQQQTRVQDHQNRMRSGPPSRRAQASSTSARCSPDALPAAERARMEARYRQIERRQGRAAAQVYVREQGRLFAERLIADGTCTADGQTASTPSRPSSRAAETDAGCRMEMVPVAGLGGAPMTMSMVPVCD